MKAYHKIMAALAGIALGALTTTVPGDAAQAQDTVRVRGTIASIDGATYVIKARDGADLRWRSPIAPRSPPWSRHRLPISSRACLWA